MSTISLIPLLGPFSPKIYVTDWNPVKPLGPTSSLRPGDTEVRRNHKGKLVMVRHKGLGTSSLYAEDVRDGRITEDVKKNKGGKGEKAEEKNDDGEKEAEFTADEDAKLTDMKTGKENKSWADIVAGMGRPKHELQKRWKELEAKAKECDGDKNNDKAANNKNEGGKGKGKGKGGASGGVGENKGDKNQKGGGDGGGGKKGAPTQEWTAEDDAKLKELYAADTEWRLMAKALKRPQPDIKARWEEIKGDVDGGKEEDKEKPKQQGGKKGKTRGGDGGGKKEENQQKKKAEAEEKKAASKANSVISKARSHASEARFTMREWMALQDDDLFSLQELQLLSHILMRDPMQSWLSVASIFHDKTGRRVHPDDIREKFEMLGSMGC